MLTFLISPNPGNMISEILAIIVSKNVGNYNFPKYWQLYPSEMLAIIILEMLVTNVSN